VDCARGASRIIEGMGKTHVHSMQNFFVPLALSVLVFLVVAFPAHSQTTTGIDLVSCSPNVPVTAEKKLETKQGDILIFTCTLTNMGDAKAAVLLSGERAKENADDTNADTSVAFPVGILPKETVKAMVPFLALFENGTYRYVISLKDPVDGHSVGASLSYTGALNASGASISGATLDKREYTSQEIATLELSVAFPKSDTAEKSSFLLDVMTKDQKGTVCAYVVGSAPVLESQATYKFAMRTDDAACRIAAVGVVVKTKEGFPTDSRDIPTAVKGAAQSAEAPESTQPGMWFSIIILIVALAIIIGYGVWHARQSFTPSNTL